MQFVTQIVLVETIVYDSSNVLVHMLAVHLLKSNKPLVKMEPSIDIVSCDSYKKSVSESAERKMSQEDG